MITKNCLRWAAMSLYLYSLVLPANTCSFMSRSLYSSSSLFILIFSRFIISFSILKMKKRCLAVFRLHFICAYWFEKILSQGTDNKTRMHLMLIFSLNVLLLVYLSYSFSEGSNSMLHTRLSSSWIVVIFFSERHSMCLAR